MIVTCIIVGVFYLWMLFETDFLRVRLPVGAKSDKTLLLPSPKPILMLPVGITKPHYAKYNIYHALKVRKGLKSIHDGDNIPENAELNSYHVTYYDIYLSPGVEPMCGYEWLNKHCGDMVDFKQHIEMNLANVRYTLDVKSPDILTEVMKANKLSRKDKLKLHKNDNPLIDYGNKIIRRKSKKLSKCEV